MSRAANGPHAQIAVWPARAIPLWWAARPASTLAAIGAGIAAIAADHVLVGVLAVVIAIVVRPVNRPWIDVLLAAAFVIPAPVVALTFAIRALVTATGVRLAGKSWSDGLETVRRGRRALLGKATIDEAWEKLARDIRDKHYVDLVSEGYEMVASAWCHADVAVLCATATEVLRSAHTGHWRFDTPPLQASLAWVDLLSVRLFATTFLAAWALPTSVVLLLDISLPLSVFSVDIPGWVVPVLVGGVTLTFPAIRLKAHLVDRALSPSQGVVLPRLGRVPGADIARRRWNEASAALAVGDREVAWKRFAEIAADHASSEAVRASAWAAMAEMALDSGDLDSAASWADQALDALPAGVDSAFVHASVGRVLVAVGDVNRAVDVLAAVVKHRRIRSNPLVVAAAYQALAASTSGEHAALRRTLRRVGWSVDLTIDVEASIALISSGVPLRERADALQLMVDTADFDARSLPSPQAWDRIMTARARAYLVLGRLRLDQGSSTEAVTALRAAVGGLRSEATAVERAVAQVLLGAALSHRERGPALEELTAGVRELERHRGRLHAPRYRNVLFSRYGTVYNDAFNAIRRLQRASAYAGELGGELAESLRRSALAQMLRTSGSDLPGPVLALQDRINRLESDPTHDHTLELRECHDRLRERLSDTFAAAYLPVAVNYPALRSRVGAAHVLTYHVGVDREDRVAGHVIWAPPGKPPVVTTFDIRDVAQLELLGARGAERREAAMRGRHTAAEQDRWLRLGTALLPMEFRRALDDKPIHLVIVPDGRLAALPWAALRLDLDQALVHAAVIQLTPTLGILEPVAADHGDTVLTHLALRNSIVEQDLHVDERVRTVSGRQEFIAALGHLDLRGVYVAGHGQDEGLGQNIRFADAGTLSAATALTLRWPSWVVFASCLVGRVSLAHGAEPLGLPISCLLGGAHTVVGGVIEVHDGATDRLAAGLADRLLNGIHPAIALRQAQLAELSRRHTPPRPITWAGLTCLSRACPPA